MMAIECKKRKNLFKEQYDVIGDEDEKDKY